MDIWTNNDGKLVNQAGERKSTFSGGQQGDCVVISVVESA